MSDTKSKDNVINYDAEIFEGHVHAFDKDGYCLVCAFHQQELLTMSGVINGA